MSVHKIKLEGEKKIDSLELVPLKLSSQIAEIFYYRAFQSYKVEKFNDALLLINKVINLAPKNYLYYRLKAKILFKLKKYQLSLKSIENAMKLRPSNPKLFKFKNKVLFLMGQFDDLLESINELSMLDSESAVENHVLKAFILGIILGKYEDALIEIKKALAIDPRFKKALEVKRKILHLRFESQLNHFYI
jgi:tetratricopeptide (TPR) repeat protein